MQKNSYLKFAATLAIICLAASGLLSVVFNITQPKILAQKLQEERSSLKEVFEDAKDFQAVEEGGETLYYKALDKDGRVLGFAFKAAKKGYSSDIVTMVGVKPDGVISRIKILSQNETPGLGTRITEVVQKETLWDIVLKKVTLGQPPRPWFQAQFDGKPSADLKSSVQAITGATISSAAVIDSIQEKAQEIMEKINNGR